ncbi:hypothetical protein Lsai_1971 [Legionella sainthelensi]|uniref:Uncharacterized protein n=1 Tax=Legionella sainthelensi TaxID=28087 RepID=A0A0W0YI99_9GAMM|nr:hypothetical protein [Legionella sainthelensi]KTD56254.1 hypothetical protein Lsai_1971 [Legionella sainthelensi]VEH31913.1 Uncharacterised protein [Legionella sainthelensi]
MITKAFFAVVALVSTSSFAVSSIHIDNVSLAKECDNLALKIAEVKIQETDKTCQSNLDVAENKVLISGKYILQTQYLLASYSLAGATVYLNDSHTHMCTNYPSLQKLKLALEPIKDKIAGLD